MNDPYPSEGEGADGGVVTGAGVPLFVVEGSSARGVLDRLASELGKRLPHESRTLPASMNREAAAALPNDGSDARKSLKTGGVAPAVPIEAEGHCQSRSESGAGARERLKDRTIGMRAPDPFDLLRERGHRFFCTANLSHQVHSDQTDCLDDGLI